MTTDWRELADDFAHVGSRVTCNPPPTDTDDDWLCLDLSDRIQHILADDGYFVCGDDASYDGSDFTAWRKGVENVIVVTDPDFYDKFVLATRLAKKFNLMIKTDRKALFQAVIYGDDYYATQEEGTL